MSPRPRGRTIGAVLAALTPEFPDLTISKIRFLEAEGLLTPERTAAGYRVFAEADIERLRFILAAQRDRFWPLKVIRDALDALDRGLAPAAPGAGATGASGATGTGDTPAGAATTAAAQGSPGGPTGLPVVPTLPADPDVPTAAALRAAPRLRLTATELTASAGLDPDMMAALGTFGLLRPDDTGHYDDAALAVATAAAALASFGVEARHLRPFRTAAEREVGLVQQIVVPALAAAGRPGRTPTAGRTGRADPTAEVLHHCLALHAALVKAELRR